MVKKFDHAVIYNGVLIPANTEIETAEEKAIETAEEKPVEGKSKKKGVK